MGASHFQSRRGFVIGNRVGARAAVFPGSSAVEQPAVNRLVAGSNPARGAKISAFPPAASERRRSLPRQAQGKITRQLMRIQTAVGRQRPFSVRFAEPIQTPVSHRAESETGLGRAKTPTFSLRIEAWSRFRQFENQRLTIRNRCNCAKFVGAASLPRADMIFGSDRAVQSPSNNAVDR